MDEEDFAAGGWAEFVGADGAIGSRHIARVGKRVWWVGEGGDLAGLKGREGGFQWGGEDGRPPCWTSDEQDGGCDGEK